MGLLFAILVGLVFGRVMSAPLIRGAYGLRASFAWLVALFILFLGLGAVLVIPGFEEADGGGRAVPGFIRSAIYLYALYGFIFFLTLWRAVRGRNFFLMIGVRYLSIFGLSSAAAGVVFAPLHTGLMVLAIYLSRRWKRKRETKRLLAQASLPAA